MATPDFILALREKVGTAPLWLSGVIAVVFKGDRVLLVRRADTGQWAPVTGIIDPGEQPADAAAREVMEEAGVRAVPERIVLVGLSGPVTYANGDRAQYLDVAFRCRWESGEPQADHAETTEARWFPLAELPAMEASMRGRVDAAAANRPEAVFEFEGRRAGGLG
jgi:8-oxo-dGTP pyrophosphatase MutT (NUDIX family)